MPATRRSQRRPARRGRRAIGVGIALALALGLGLWGWLRAGDSPPAPMEEIGDASRARLEEALREADREGEPVPPR